jgi:hypothetical protein
VPVPLTAIRVLHQASLATDLSSNVIVGQTWQQQQEHDNSKSSSSVNLGHFRAWATHDTSGTTSATECSRHGAIRWPICVVVFMLQGKTYLRLRRVGSSARVRCCL